MTWDTRFRAFLATQTPHGVTRELAILTPGDLPAGDVTIRVTWSSVNYKDALATVPGGKVAQLRRPVPGIDLAGQVVASTASGVPVGSQVIVTGHGLGVSHHGGWAQYARVPAAWALPLPRDCRHGKR